MDTINYVIACIQAVLCSHVYCYNFVVLTNLKLWGRLYKIRLV